MNYLRIQINKKIYLCEREIVLLEFLNVGNAIIIRVRIIIKMTQKQIAMIIRCLQPNLFDSCCIFNGSGCIRVIMIDVD